MGKASIQESSSKSDMKTEFENNDSGNDISDGDAKGLFFFFSFFRMAKNGLNV
jgi:hypothetical protein